jgi:hypothetical protein
MILRIKRHILSITVALISVIVLATCTTPDKVSGPPGVPPDSIPSERPGPPASVQIERIGELVVNQTSLLKVVVMDSVGHVLSGYSPTFASSDTSIAEVSSTGVIRAKWPGVASITATVLSLTGSAPARVTSRLRIGLVAIADWGDPIELAVGDTVSLKPYVSDANGHYLDIKPTVTWTSTNPAGISVDANGKMTALQDGAKAQIQAVGPEGVGLKNVQVSVPVTGEMATLRVAHAADGIGTITFIPNKGKASTVTAGQSATIQVPPGLLTVSAQGAPQAFRDFPSITGVTIRPGEKVTLYIVGLPSFARLEWVWSHPQNIAADSAVLDIMQGSPGYPVLYVQRPGEALGNPANCYWDWTDITGWGGKPGPVDLQLLGKYPSRNIEATLRVDAKGGTLTQVILTGTITSKGYFIFPDL